jgi:hypothetical protein
MPRDRADSVIMSIAIQTVPAPAGWYPDPADVNFLRWWDGSVWTTHLQNRPVSISSAYRIHRTPKPRF